MYLRPPCVSVSMCLETQDNHQPLGYQPPPPISSYFYVFVPAISYPNSPSLHDTCAKKRRDHRAFTGGGEGEGLVDPSTHRAPPLGVTGVGRCAWPESSEQNPVEALVGHGRDTTEITRPQPPSIIMPESLSSSFQEQGQLT